MYIVAVVELNLVERLLEFWIEFSDGETLDSSETPVTRKTDNGYPFLGRRFVNGVLPEVVVTLVL
jgi:hypothetical protein